MGVAALVAACFTKPGPPQGTVDAATDDALDAAFVPPDCDGVLFAGQATTVVGPVDGTEATFTDDELEIHFTEYVANSEFEIYVAKRTVNNLPFQTQQLASFTLAGSNDTEPAITADGLMLVFVSNRAGAERPFVVERASRTSPWSTPTELAFDGFATLQMRSLDLSWDGLRLFFVDVGENLVMATRTSRSAPFQLVGNYGSGLRYPAVSTDGKEIYYVKSPTDELWRASRTSTTEPFANHAFTGLAGFDPELSRDGQTLHLSRGSSIVKYTRTCPAR